MALPVKQRLDIYKGGVFRHRFRLLDENDVAVNITGYSVRMQIRENWDSPTYAIELTSANNRIELTPASGIMDLYMSATDTSALTINSGVYDLEAIPPSGEASAIKIAYGTVRIMPEATR